MHWRSEPGGHGGAYRQAIQGAGPKRVLSLNGGGVRGMISIGYLAAIEALLANRFVKKWSIPSFPRSVSCRHPWPDYGRGSRSANLARRRGDNSPRSQHAPFRGGRCHWTRAPGASAWHGRGRRRNQLITRKCEYKKIVSGRKGGRVAQRSLEDRELTRSGPRGTLAHVTFAEPVLGPLAFGFGAHFGLGQLLPVGDVEPDALTRPRAGSGES